jgi:pseudaminic acid cytidylyltransferase
MGDMVCVSVLEHEMKSIAIIPARGGSRRIPNKNVRHFHGKPIIGYSIETARESGLFSRIIVTTDSDYIASVARDFRAEIVLRKPEYAVDSVGTQEVMRQTMRQVVNDYEHGRENAELACCIYATAPLMSSVDLARGLAELHENRKAFAYSCGFDQSITGPTTPNLADAGQFYWGHTWAFIGGVPLKDHSSMVLVDSDRVCDINTEEDWQRAEKMYAALEEAK